MLINYIFDKIGNNLTEEKIAKLNSIRDFLDANPDLKNEFLNNYV